MTAASNVRQFRRRTKNVQAKTPGQQDYLDSIELNTLTFGVGPAGSGKTYLAVAQAANALMREEVTKLVITRPAVEAGEKLGFLPGTFLEKLDPYMKPVFDSLIDIVGNDQVLQWKAEERIEIAPFAYLRGRSLPSSFILIDEAQNATPAQMKMALTRLGHGSKVVVNGDLTQSDLPEGPRGLREALNALSGIDDIGMVFLSAKDVIRHPLVSKITEAYERYAD